MSSAATASPPDEIRAAIDAWHESLSPELAAESSEWLTEQLRRRGLFFGDRPLCTVLRPRFLSPGQYDFIRQRLGELVGAFDRALAAALEQPRVLAQFRLLEWERILALEEPRIAPSPVSRLDAFLDPADGRLRCTEYNAETPAGSAYHDALTELFLTIPAMRPFLRDHAVRSLPARHQVLHQLLEAWRSWSGRAERPVIGILDWLDVPTRSEFELYREYFESLGLHCVVADVRSCEYRGNRLLADGAPIDLVYKRVLISELVERGGLDHPLVRAVREGAVCMANPFRCKILHKKASLAVLSDERNAGLFSDRERWIIQEHVPWTRVVEERRTQIDGLPIDLVPWIRDHRERLVLKPNDEYGGAGIVLGWEVGAAEWEAAVARALAVPTIVQERIGLPSESFPSVADGELVFADRIVDTAPFVFGGHHVDSCLTRVSTATLVNVTAGGGSTVPTFVVERRF